jgi:hypothetical protein
MDSSEQQLLLKLDELTNKLRDKDIKLSNIEKEYIEKKTLGDKIQYLYTKVFQQYVESRQENESLIDENNVLQFRNEEVKGLFKTLKENAIKYKEKMKTKTND